VTNKHILLEQRAAGKLMTFLIQTLGTACPGNEYLAHIHAASVL
jgi:hypothetical protein